jgi:hypothetical protein
VVSDLVAFDAERVLNDFGGAVSPACRRIISSTMARSSSGKPDSTARSSSVKASATLFGLCQAVMRL